MGSAERKLTLHLLPDILAVCRLAPDTPLPEWAAQDGFVSITRTSDELTVVIPQEHVPEGVQAQRDFRALKVAGPLAFDEIGILAAIAGPLASAGISIFAVSTYDTDYVLVRQTDLGKALGALRDAGHTVAA